MFSRVPLIQRRGESTNQLYRQLRNSLEELKAEVWKVLLHKRIISPEDIVDYSPEDFI